MAPSVSALTRFDCTQFLYYNLLEIYMGASSCLGLTEKKKKDCSLKYISSTVILKWFRWIEPVTGQKPPKLNEIKINPVYESGSSIHMDKALKGPTVFVRQVLEKTERSVILLTEFCLASQFGGYISLEVTWKAVYNTNGLGSLPLLRSCTSKIKGLLRKSINEEEDKQKNRFSSLRR